MATVEDLWYCEDVRKSEYGSPSRIGWDEEDTKIRLRSIARAWVELLSLKQFGAAKHSDKVWSIGTFHTISGEDIFLMVVTMQHAEVAAITCMCSAV
jgi:hypothetical protein